MATSWIVISQFLKLKIQNQFVDRVALTMELLRKNPLFGAIIFSFC